METHPQKEYPAHVREQLQRRFADLTYRFRPDQPSEGLEYVRIASAAKKLVVSVGEPMKIAVWNTYKGKRERYYTFLAERAGDADLILLQEFRHDPVLEGAHRELFATRDADMAISF